MRDLGELVALCERGVYTFGEAVTALIGEAAARSPAELARHLPQQFIEEVSSVALSPPESATAEDCVVVKSDRAHAEQWFEGAVNWRRHFLQRSTRGTT